MFDLVPHGPPDFTPLAKEHPEWISLDAKGKPSIRMGRVRLRQRPPGLARLHAPRRRMGRTAVRGSRGAGGLRGRRTLELESRPWATALPGRAWRAAWG